MKLFRDKNNIEKLFTKLKKISETNNINGCKILKPYSEYPKR